MSAAQDFKTSSVTVPTLDSETERSLLSACLSGGRRCVEEAMEAGVAAADFQNQRLARMWSSMVGLVERETHVDTLTVVEDLQHAGQLDNVGGAASVMQLSAMASSTAALAMRARAVVNNAGCRRVAQACQDLKLYAEERSMPAVELMALAQETFLALNQRVTGSIEVVDRAATVNQVLESAGKSAPGAVPTGFKELDVLFRGGLRPGNTTILAGRPGMGKTALALAIASNVADLGLPVGFLSLEVPAADLIEREIAAVTGLAPSTWAFRQNQHRLSPAAEFVTNRPLHFVDRAGLTVSEVCAQARRMRSRLGIELLVVDHLGKVKPSDRYAGDRNNEVSEISEALRVLASHLHIPVLALSQLNRAVETRPDKRPSLGDLRDSGSLEQDAYAVLFAFRAEYYLKDKTPEDTRGVCEVDVAKNRGGPTDTVRLRFDAPTSRFSSMGAN